VLSVPVNYPALVNAVRLELEAAGNPAFVTAVVDGSGTTHASPVVFSSIGPAADHAHHVALAAADGETVLIVSRQSEGPRQLYSVLAPGTLKRLHAQHEVIETAVAERLAI
jgi:hypothetical protein